MDEQQERTAEQEQRFIQGFNHGYLLTKQRPELSTKLAANERNTGDYFQGFGAGRQEYEKEVREWAKGFSHGIPGKEDREQGHER